MKQGNTASSVAAYTLDGFTAAFGVGRTRMYREIKAGRLRAKKSGKRTIILAADAEEWAASLPDFEVEEVA
ncbi:MAG: DNA-binding protein [Nitratireductor sp.]